MLAEQPAGHQHFHFRAVQADPLGAGGKRIADVSGLADIRHNRQSGHRSGHLHLVPVTGKRALIVRQRFARRVEDDVTAIPVEQDPGIRGNGCGQVVDVADNRPVQGARKDDGVAVRPAVGHDEAGGMAICLDGQAGADFFADEDVIIAQRTVPDAAVGCLRAVPTGGRMPEVSQQALLDLVDIGNALLQVFRVGARELFPVVTQLHLDGRFGTAGVALNGMQ